MHLVAGGWYLDYSCGFVPDVEESLYKSFVSSVIEVIELEEELEENNPAPSYNEKEVASIKSKGKGRKVVPHASSQVSIHSFTNASVQRYIAQATNVVGSPTANPSAPAPDPIAILFYSGATILSVSRKRKVVAPDTTATFTERSSSISLIENVDMGMLIEDLIKTKVPLLTYRRIQEFPTKVCMLFYYFSHSFHGIKHLFFLFFFDFLLFKLERAVLVQTPSLRFTQALIYHLLMCPRT